VNQPLSKTQSWFYILDDPKRVFLEWGKICQEQMVTEFIPRYSTPQSNRQVVLARRPTDLPLADDFECRTEALTKPEPGQFLVRNLYLSADTAQHGWSADPALTPIGAPMRALAVGIVQESRDLEVARGDVVYGFFGWQDYALATQAELLSRVSTPRAPLSYYAGVLGIPGVTAWLALNDLAVLAPGDAILVSTAAGAVGSIAGQIARQCGAYVVGLTGSDDKIHRCRCRFGYNAVFNDHAADLAETLAAARPEGFKVYFDSSGCILESALHAMAKNGRIIQCGTVARDAASPLRDQEIPALTWSGFHIFDHVARFGEAVDALTELMLARGLNHDEEIDHGIAHAPASLAALFAGTNLGKKLIFVG
jgi:NADPH-dependent curcumin reductase CurA